MWISEHFYRSFCFCTGNSEIRFVCLFVSREFQMDKASIIKDAIDYIQELHEQERRIQAEISELETGKSKKSPPGYEFEQEIPVLASKSKKKRTQHFCESGGSRFCPIDVLEVRCHFLLIQTKVFFPSRTKLCNN